jgi:hypothetical protein
MLNSEFNNHLKISGQSFPIVSGTYFIEAKLYDYVPLNNLQLNAYIT